MLLSLTLFWTKMKICNAYSDFFNLLYPPFFVETGL